ncbi:uncharacterized protein Z520_03688 [Fonsecaea multimorphosa CBS 102226]|uniref:Uncharacterized protein n=1 Tax=Fonsecaea multimorphosa CBS 102226 TaxID=1442371 RepID=A0A0D2IVD7_9EURO|nr:uncharacterized protein Z520_03688 [Fonsecaea multimorphosa CBS 102226]KIY01022.1 hypothetical protein Z520_03688 [Fonsecaea multimorphosa CBS 102226]OAL27606.1 hypothetical protein AYO22_03510 [Fonsecaea multimorphosa]
MSEVLERDLKQLEDDVIGLKIREQVCKRITAQYEIITPKLSESLEKIKEIASKLAIAEQQCHEYDAKKKELNKRIICLKERSSKIDQMERESADQIEEFQKERDKELTLLRKLEAKRRDDDSTRKDLQAELLVPTEALREAQICGGATVKVKAALQKQIDKIQDSLTSLEREIKGDEKRLESCQKKIDTLERNIADANAAHTKEKEEISKELKEKRKDRDKARDLAKKSENDRKVQQAEMEREVSSFMGQEDLDKLEKQRKEAFQQMKRKEKLLRYKKDEFRKFWRKAVDGNDKRRAKIADVLEALKASKDAPAERILPGGQERTNPKMRLGNLQRTLGTIIGDLEGLLNEWPERLN